MLSFFLIISPFIISSASYADSLSNLQSNVLQITYPNGGETLSGEVTVEWILAQEYRTVSTHYHVYYSPDNGQNWIQLAFAIFDTQYNWNTTLFETYGSLLESQYPEQFGSTTPSPPPPDGVTQNTSFTGFSIVED